MRIPGRALALAGIACVVAAAAWAATAAATAWAAHPIDGATYRGRIAKQHVALKVSRNGRTMRFRGTATLGVWCPPFGTPTGRPTAVVVISSRRRLQRTENDSPPPLVRIHADGTFAGARKGLRFSGTFTGKGRGLVLHISLPDIRGCYLQRSRYRFHLRPSH
jgi:hypothetical protein